MKSRIVVCAMVALVAVPWFIEFAAGQSTLPLTKQQQTSGAPQFLMLLRTPEVGKDVELTASQRAELEALAREFVTAMYKLHQETNDARVLFKDLPEQQREILTFLRKGQITLSQDVDTRAIKLVDKKQLRRVGQLLLRARGWSLFLDPEIRQRLRISEDQYNRLSDVFAECSEACEECVKQGREQQTPKIEMFNKVNELRRDAFERMVTLLTPSQQSLLDQFLGPRPAFHPDELKLEMRLEISSAKAKQPRQEKQTSVSERPRSKDVQ